MRAVPGGEGSEGLQGTRMAVPEPASSTWLRGEEGGSPTEPQPCHPHGPPLPCVPTRVRDTGAATSDPGAAQGSSGMWPSWDNHLMDKPQLANKEKERPEGCDKRHRPSREAPGRTQLCRVGCSPTSTPMCCPGPAWHKAGDGRSCVMVGGLTQGTVCCCDTAPPEQRTSTGSVRKSHFHQPSLKNQHCVLPKAPQLWREQGLEVCY